MKAGLPLPALLLVVQPTMAVASHGGDGAAFVAARPSSVHSSLDDSAYGILNDGEGVGGGGGGEQGGGWANGSGYESRYGNSYEQGAGRRDGAGLGEGWGGPSGYESTYGNSYGEAADRGDGSGQGGGEDDRSGYGAASRCGNNMYIYYISIKIVTCNLSNTYNKTLKSEKY
uniref:Uncharacterized protein n=1 Tax=Oryza sativa subsp. japonica TaxID=39947 RepID=Q2R4M4_ORYSJ|nr:hypothetical protein LOC_Os11g27970 [Oryza sativa Japonica Group]